MFKKVVDTGKHVDLTGNKYNLLTVLGLSNDVYIEPKHGWKYLKWDCKCECGNIISVRTSELKSGKVKSCGCLRDLKSSERAYKHGKSKTRLYRLWSSMKDRCYNPDNARFYRYGGRGIKVCDEWKNDFSTFEKWAILNGYDESLSSTECTIDRINNDKDYCPENCRWTNSYTQANNRSMCHLIMYNGEAHNITEWSNILGIDRRVLSYRLLSGNWTIEEAFTVPVGKYIAKQRQKAKEKEYGTGT